MKNIKRTIALLLCTIICFSAAMGDIVPVRAGGTMQETETDVGVPKPEEDTTSVKEPEAGHGSPGGQEESSVPKPTESEEQKEQPAPEENVDSVPEEPDQKPLENEPVTEKTPAVENETDGIPPAEDTVTSAQESAVATAPKSSAVVFTVENIKNAGIEDGNFAQAIYDSITAQSGAFLDGYTLENNPYTTMKELLNNFNGEIKANKKGIESIIGIPMLKSCTKIDLSFNQIKDIRPISVTSAINGGEVNLEDQIYYGTRGKNLVFSFMGNPIRQYPVQVGGRILFQPELSNNSSLLNDYSFSFIMADTGGTYEVEIPLDLYRGSERVDLFTGFLDDGLLYYYDESGTLRAKHETDKETDAQLVSNISGTLPSIKVDSIRKSGVFSLDLGIDQAQQGMGYHTVRNAASDRVTGTSQTLGWILPVEVKLYTKVEKDSIETKHSVNLKKLGLDDGAVKKGAKYSLYKKGSEADKDVKLGEYTTDENGQISVPDLKAGEYYFQENADGAPNGYLVNPEPVEFILTDGTIALVNKSGSVIDLGEGTLSPEINGSYVLGGDEADSVHLTVTPPAEGGSLDSLTLKWTEGNQGGSPGTKKIVVGTGNDSDIIYVVDQEEAITKAEELLKNCQKLGQNATISVSFKQDIELEQKDSLAPIQVSLEAVKKLRYASGEEILEVPEGKFNFVLKNDPAYPNEPDIGIIEAVNGGPDGKKVMFDPFSIGNEITVDTPKDADGNYLYHYVISENNDGDPNYTYDSEIVKAEVTIGKKESSDDLEIKKIVYKKGTLETESNEFANTLLALPFEFTKVDGTNHKTVLERVKFALYECRNNNADHAHKEMVTKDIADCWTLLEETISNRDGLVKFKDLPSGSYQLVETATNPAYELPLGQWRIQVDVAANTVVIEAKGSDRPPAFFTDTQDSEKRMLPNYKKKVLPMAGGRGTAGFTFIGLGIVITGLAMFGCTGKKRRRKC